MKRVVGCNLLRWPVMDATDGGHCNENRLIWLQSTPLACHGCYLDPSRGPPGTEGVAIYSAGLSWMLLNTLWCRGVALKVAIYSAGLSWMLHQQAVIRK